MGLGCDISALALFWANRGVAQRQKLNAKMFLTCFAECIYLMLSLVQGADIS
jgi:hypothetical protein